MPLCCLVRTGGRGDDRHARARPDFRLAWSSPFDLGYKSAAVNLADVAAMGRVRARSLCSSRSRCPTDTPISFVRGFADGLAAACAELAPDCAVEGGDLTVSDTLNIAVTALGSLDGREPVRRSGAASETAST